MRWGLGLRWSRRVATSRLPVAKPIKSIQIQYNTGTVHTMPLKLTKNQIEYRFKRLDNVPRRPHLSCTCSQQFISPQPEMEVPRHGCNVVDLSINIKPSNLHCFRSPGTLFFHFLVSCSPNMPWSGRRTSAGALRETILFSNCQHQRDVVNFISQARGILFALD